MLTSVRKAFGLQLRITYLWVLNLREESILSLHCFSLSSSDVAFLAHPGEAGEIKPLFGSFFNWKVSIWLYIMLVFTHCYETFTVKAFKT